MFVGALPEGLYSGIVGLCFCLVLKSCYVAGKSNDDSISCDQIIDDCMNTKMPEDCYRDCPEISSEPAYYGNFFYN